MSLIKEMHAQPGWVRVLLFGLSCLTVISVAGYLWLGSFQRNIIVAADPDGGPERAARLERQRPDPLSFIREGAGFAVAGIGRLIGFDRDAGFDIGKNKGDNTDSVHLLPLSE